MYLDDAAEAIRFKLYAGEVVPGGNDGFQPGTLVTDNKTYLQVAVKDGFIRLTNMQVSGKKRLKTVDFLRGYTFPEHAFFK